MRPPSNKDAAQDHLGHDTDQDCKSRFLEALEHAKCEMSNQQDAGNKDRRKEPVIERKLSLALDVCFEYWWRSNGCADIFAHAVSFTLLTCPTTGFSTVWIFPDGQ